MAQCETAQGSDEQSDFSFGGFEAVQCRRLKAQFVALAQFISLMLSAFDIYFFLGGGGLKIGMMVSDLQSLVEDVRLPTYAPLPTLQLSQWAIVHQVLTQESQKETPTIFPPRLLVTTLVQLNPTSLCLLQTGWQIPRTKIWQTS